MNELIQEVAKGQISRPRAYNQEEEPNIIKSNPIIKNMNTKFEYLHVSSLDRETTTAESDAVLNINLSGHSIKNIRNVAVKSFSINNSLFNITFNRNKLNFVLTKAKTTPAGTFESKLFTITLPLGYYENKDLVDTNAAGASGIINQLLSAEKSNSGFKVGGELNAHTIEMRYDPDTFKMGLYGEAGSGTSFSSISITPLREQGDDLWNCLGFTHDQTAPLDEYLINNNITHASNAIYKDQTYALHPSTASAAVKETPTIQAGQSASLENIQGLYLTSRSMVQGGTYESSLINGHIQARPKNILEWIQFDGAHYSTISYKPDILHQHYLNGKELNHIDVGITNIKGEYYKWREIGHFHLVLVFECLIQDEISAQFIKQYNDEGYQRAHTADKIMYGKFK